jgi:flagellar protein FliJ
MNAAVQSLLVVREQARSVRDEAQRALQQVERQCTQARSQGQTLHSYRTDTAVRWVTPRGRNTDAIQMDTARNFLARLDHALDQHQTSLQQSVKLALQRRAALLAAETRLAAIDKLIERRQRQANTQHERREQQAIDQMAQRPRAPVHADPHDPHAPQDQPDPSHPSAPHQETQPCPH